MELLLFAGLFMIAIVFLIKTNNPNKLEISKSINLFIFISVIKAIILFFITGCLFASIFNVEWNGQHHPHSMLGLLYIWFGLFGLILGAIVGLILSSFNKKNLNKKLIMGSLMYFILCVVGFFGTAVIFS